ncbi:glycoside hydrolase family 15 protein [Natronosporangium hydrolyticum]|uniref:Glycoside hydrolase family 15 protein n=1 Tax=Natronosporangium hydrolyticum TaxID=2811111 RepID=A0A895YEK2_9ACTN|nr:glycoside hydrolase family 15 protein [Natronosporangium hydrolyticum]
MGRDGGISWLCVPRFDSPPVFCGLLDHERGGVLRIAPTAPAHTRQYYLDDTGVLVTEFETDTGVLSVTDAFVLADGADLSGAPAGRGELVRALQVPHGDLEVELVLSARGQVDVARSAGGLRINSSACPDVTLQVGASAPLAGTRTTWRLRTGDRVYVWLRWKDQQHSLNLDLDQGGPSNAAEAAERLASTIGDWQRWSERIRYDGPQPELVRRSAITLKMLDYAEDGAIVAAPTSSLPEEIGGERNWDYRFTWIRDAAFSVYALRQLGLGAEADHFLSWVLDMVDREGEPRVLYDLDGGQPSRERIDAELAGYRGSNPVRWGNAAADQTQHDVYGEILDCAHQRVSNGYGLDPGLWQWLARLANLARERWQQPDHGIWEVRSAARPFTYSVAMCQVALERAARIADQLDLPGDRAGWEREATAIRRAILEQAWDPKQEAITEQLGSPEDGASSALDASVLALPLRQVISGAHPAMVSTTRAVVDRLGAGDGLLYRYLVDDSPDGLAGHEGAFLLCSFWLADNWTRQGRIDEAGQLYESLCARANPLGLLPEQIDPTTGAFLGNFPQAFSHVGVITSGLNLAEALRKDRAETEA